MNIFAILRAVFSLWSLTLVAAELNPTIKTSFSIGNLASPEKLHEVFAQLEKSSDLKDDDLKILKSAEPLLISLRGKSKNDKDNAEALSTYVSLMKLLQGLSWNTTYQLSLKIISIATADDYVRQAGFNVLYLHHPHPDISHLHPNIEIMMAWDRLKADQWLIFRDWIKLGQGKMLLSRAIQNLLHIPPEKQVPISLLLPKGNPWGTAVPWLLATLELAKTLPENKNSIPAIDTEIQYVKDNSK